MGERRYAVIGAGHGGKAMAADLAAKGFSVKLYNRTPTYYRNCLAREIELERGDGTIQLIA
jgi:3-hydroxyisobutyrate dehydrogenase-like beta-hydroxyacid dehydrogenase